MWWRNVLEIPGGSTTKLFGEEEEIEYDKNRDITDGRTTVRNKGGGVGKARGIFFLLEGGEIFLRNRDKNTRRTARDLKRNKYVTSSKKRTADT
jgi:hypothetical protein